MSASHAPALDAIAFQLAASLEKYDADVDRLVATWLDMEVYRSVSAQVEVIRSLSAGLPSTTVYWIELLIAHTELIHALWRQDALGTDRPVSVVHARHTRCVATLRATALRYLMRN